MPDGRQDSASGRRSGSGERGDEGPGIDPAAAAPRSPAPARREARSTGPLVALAIIVIVGALLLVIM